jgi:hypothetical protein
MQKIISLFQRNYDGDHLVRDEVVPGAEWVVNGEGVATRKWDGVCCLSDEGHLFRRVELKKGATVREGFIPADDPDPITGKQPGWMEIGDGPEDVWHRLALHNKPFPPDGTYELIGPRINGNADHSREHQLVRHGEHTLIGCPRTFDALRDYLTSAGIEGVVWHHRDGRMVKIKARDFGLKRRPSPQPTQPCETEG